MFPGFEMRIWEAEEDVFKLATGEEVREEFHSVSPEGRDVLIRA